METITKYFLTKEEFDLTKNTFKTYCKTNMKLLKAEDFILFNVIFSRDIKKGFSPIVRESKLRGNNGNHFSAFDAAKYKLKYNLKFSPLIYKNKFDLSSENIAAVLSFLNV